MTADSFATLTRNPRVTVRRAGPPDPDGRAVVYWMQRAQRAVDNPALETAIDAANLLGKPVVTFFGLRPSFPGANLRHYQFMVEGLADTAARLRQRGVGFIVRSGPDPNLTGFCDEVRAALVIGDENPLREPERWRQQTAEKLRLPFWTVDADVIVPTKLIEKEQYAARTIRPRVRVHLNEFLTPIKRRTPRVAWKDAARVRSLAPDVSLLEDLGIDRSVSPVAAFKGGTSAGLQILKRFVQTRLADYTEGRNHPERDATSQLSPYLHFGQLGPHTVALAVENAAAPRACRDAFLEQLIVRRELAVNFVRYNLRYDQLTSCEPWALKTLAEHARDEREYIYTERQLADAETHDRLWNAAQQQMVTSGWMHGYLRMYWAKKILEWTRSPEEAFDIAVRLNDKYELDGRDPNGYTGIAWAIGGKHDRAWGPERPIYGKVRYMSYASTSRKFNSQAYISMVKAAGL